MPNNKFTVLDLFCGCGGFTQGMTDAGLNILAGIDIWNMAIETYKSNHNHISLCKDLTKYSPEEFSNEYNIKLIDIIIGGPPCQGFSIAGKRDKNDPRNSLFMEFVKYIDYFKPKAFIMENVIGILSMKTSNNEKAINIIMTELTKKYNCKYFKLSATDFEVPQIRKRTIFIGFRNDLKIEPTEPIKISANNHVPVKTILTKRENVDNRYFLSEKALQGINYKKEKMLQKGYGYGAKYVNLDKPCYTIPARYWKDGYDALVKYSDNDVRRLTEEELAKIQSFPSTYIFKGSRKDIIIQIGNAVACKFAYYLGKYIIDKLEKINYEQLLNEYQQEILNEKTIQNKMNIIQNHMMLINSEIEHTDQKFRDLRKTYKNNNNQVKILVKSKIQKNKKIKLNK